MQERVFVLDFSEISNLILEQRIQIFQLCRCEVYIGCGKCVCVKGG